jgi:hypothetical protein
VQGGSGSWYTSNPGNGSDVISVASVDKQVKFVLQVLYNTLNLLIALSLEYCLMHLSEQLVSQFVAGVPITLTSPQSGFQDLMEVSS